MIAVLLALSIIGIGIGGTGMLTGADRRHAERIQNRKR